jgi:hypothetical protein
MIAHAMGSHHRTDKRTIPAGEPRTCAILCDRGVKTRKRRAKCRCAVTIAGGRLKNAGVWRKSLENRNVVESARVRGPRARRVPRAVKLIVRTNSPSSIVYNCGTAALKSPEVNSSGADRARIAARAQWTVAKILSSGWEPDTEPKIPPWALIMASPIW